MRKKKKSSPEKSQVDLNRNPNGQTEGYVETLRWLNLNSERVQKPLPW